MTFTVIIPTLQRVKGTSALVRDLTESPHVSEILVVNNAASPVPYESPKMRELHQPTNIFVNPAWNLGAEEARYDHLCFANDDIRFDVSLFSVMRRLLRLPVGIIAPHESVFVPEISPDVAPAPRGSLRLRPAYRRTNGFGTLMFMRRESFTTIPTSLKVWFGDDYLFHRQKHRNLVFRGAAVYTAMSSTSGTDEFVSMGDAETQAYLEIGMGDYEHRFRHDLQAFRALKRAASSANRPRRGG